MESRFEPIMLGVFALWILLVAVLSVYGLIQVSGCSTAEHPAAFCTAAEPVGGNP